MTSDFALLSSMANTPSRALSPDASVGARIWWRNCSLIVHSAYGVFRIENTALHNWQYLYIIEGGLTILLGTVAWFWLPHGLESAWFLSVEDRQFATERILEDNAGYMSQDTRENLREKPTLSTRDVKETFRDWKLWYVLVFNICASVPGQAFSVFLPLVVQGLGYSSLRANLVRRSKLLTL